MAAKPRASKRCVVKLDGKSASVWRAMLRKGKHRGQALTKARIRLRRGGEGAQDRIEYLTRRGRKRSGKAPTAWQGAKAAPRWDCWSLPDNLAMSARPAK
jgi:hypothetical protein